MGGGDRWASGSWGGGWSNST